MVRRSRRPPSLYELRRAREAGKGRFLLPAEVTSKGQVLCLHHIEILITEKNPGIVFIFQTVAARDVQRDLKVEQRPVKSIPLGTQAHVELFPQ